MAYYINLSNHQDNSWSSAKSITQKEYGEIIDISFTDASFVLNDKSFIVS